MPSRNIYRSPLTRSQYTSFIFCVNVWVSCILSFAHLIIGSTPVGRIQIIFFSENAPTINGRRLCSDSFIENRGLFSVFLEVGKLRTAVEVFVSTASFALSEAFIVFL